MPHLRHAVESLQKQTLSDFKVLIIDDGSTDTSAAYLASLNDPRFTITHQDNVGLAITLNRMLSLVDTEYVARLDADDICLPKRLEMQLKFMDAHPEIAVAGARQGYVFGSRWRASLAFGWSRLTPSYSPPMKNPPYWDPDMDGNILVHSAVIMRADILRTVGGYPEIVPGQDLALWFRISEAGYKLASMDEMLMLVRISPSGISSNNISRQYRTWDYLHFSHQIRLKGESPPSLDDFLAGHPENAVTLEHHMSKVNLRNACGILLEGNFLKGLTGIFRVWLRDPNVIIQKMRLRLCQK